MLAQIRSNQTHDGASEYVKTLFDDYSDNFESSSPTLITECQSIAEEIASIRKAS